jgi:hypothetical protein
MDAVVAQDSAALHQISQKLAGLPRPRTSALPPLRWTRPVVVARVVHPRDLATRGRVELSPRVAGTCVHHESLGDVGQHHLERVRPMTSPWDFTFFARRAKNGADGARTRDLVAASDALSQLSYGPKPAQCSGEIMILGPVDSAALIVSRRGQTQLNVGSAGEVRKPKQVASAQLGAIGGERVHLGRRIRAPDQSMPCATAREAADETLP